jgi:DNA-binding transcriptional LysR family regulator
MSAKMNQKSSPPSDAAIPACVLIIAGLGLALIPPFAVDEELRAGSLVPLLRTIPAQWS